MALVCRPCSDTTRIIKRTQCRTIMPVDQDHVSVYVSPEVIVKMFKKCCIIRWSGWKEAGNVGSLYERERTVNVRQDGNHEDTESETDDRNGKQSSSETDETE